MNWTDTPFVGGGVSDGFMQRGLENLLNHIDTTFIPIVGQPEPPTASPLLSPLCSETLEMEQQAQEIVDGAYYGSHEQCE